MLGKMEVSFEQCYHEVQCIKDHYPESVFQESIMQFLKGAAVDMARYTAGIAQLVEQQIFMWGGPGFNTHSQLNLARVDSAFHPFVGR